MTTTARSILFGLVSACLTFTAVATCLAQEASRQDTIASLADRYTITFPDLQQYAHDYLYDVLYRQNPAEGYGKALDDMIQKQLKRFDFFSLGYDRDAALLQDLRRPINEELKNRYYRAQFYQKYVNENRMRDIYSEMDREVIFRQIALDKPKHASRATLDSLKAQAVSVASKLRKGANSGTLPPNTVQTADWRSSLSDSLSDLMFHLPVNEVRVVESRQAFLILQNLRIDHKEVGPYTTVKEDIRKALDDRYAEPSYDEFEQAKEKLLDGRKVTWNAKTLKQLVRWSNIPKFYQTQYADTLRNAIAQGRNLVVFTSPGTRVDLREYLRLLDEILIPVEKVPYEQDDLKRFTLEAVRTNLVVDKAVALGLEKDVLTPTTSSPVLKEGIVRLYNRRQIEDHIPPASEAAFREFYQANKDSLYYQLAKVNIYAIINSRKNDIDEMKTKLVQGVAFEKLAPQMLVKTYIRKRDGTLATYLGTEPPFLAAPAFRLKVGEVAGPLEYVDSSQEKQYALIKCVGLREERQLSYDDARKTIAADFATFHRERIARSVQDQLMKKYTVKIYRDTLRKNLAAIGPVGQ